MYRKDFCEIGLLRQMIAANKKWPNVIINTKTNKEQRADIKGTLSIFSSDQGVGYYTADKHTVSVNEDCFFISNEHQHYGIDIQEQTETFNIHFSTDMLRQLHPTFTHNNEQLLDNNSVFGDEVNFYNKLYWKDSFFRNTTALLQEKAKTSELTGLYTEELLADLLIHIYRQQANINTNINSLSVAKHTTRQEVAKRLSAATDYIHSYYAKNISLDELATIACLSKYHFLRLFKEVHRCTPYQYIISIRLDKAKQLLINTMTTVNDIAWCVGYENVSSFCRGFKKQYNEWPQAYRALVQK